MTHCIMRGSEILAKKKSTENQVISVLCGDLPFCPVTPERTINMNEDELS